MSLPLSASLTCRQTTAPVLPLPGSLQPVLFPCLFILPEEDNSSTEGGMVRVDWCDHFLLLVPVSVSHLPECGQAQHTLLSWKPLWFWALLWYGLHELSAPLALWKQRHLEDKWAEATNLILDTAWKRPRMLIRMPRKVSNHSYAPSRDWQENHWSFLQKRVRLQPSNDGPAFSRHLWLISVTMTSQHKLPKCYWDQKLASGNQLFPFCSKDMSKHSPVKGSSTIYINTMYENRLGSNTQVRKM